MVCYLVRHGKDDDTVRGGWSDHPLTAEGFAQVAELAESIEKNNDVLSISRIYTSDLMRAKQTAECIARRIGIPVTYAPGFREVNNGALAGMKHERANALNPGMFWNTLEWEQSYPGGESPKAFYERISAAWASFESEMLGRRENTLLVTHGGVIDAIYHIVNGQPCSNKEKPYPVPHAKLIALEYVDGRWMAKS